MSEVMVVAAAGLLLIGYGLFSLVRPDLRIAFEIRRLERYPWTSWPFGRDWYQDYLSSGKYRATVYVVGIGSVLIGAAFLWIAGRLTESW
jgi:hypothetical protein